LQADNASSETAPSATIMQFRIDSVPLSPRCRNWQRRGLAASSTDTSAVSSGDGS